MIVAFSLLLASQDAVKPARTFEEILQAANKAWYELPQATTSVRYFINGEEEYQMAEIREDRKSWLRVGEKKQTTLEIRNNGSETASLDYKKRQYSLEPASDRPRWDDRKLEPKEPLEPETFHFNFSNTIGLEIGVAGKQFQVQRDPLTDNKGRLLVSAILIGRSVEGQGTSRITFSATLGSKLGHFRNAVILVTDADEPDKTAKVVWECSTGAQSEAVYDFDPSQFVGWTKVDGGLR